MKSIKGVEVFSVGTWNGDEYTKEDLIEMESAFNETHVGMRPYLKLGHDKTQKLLQTDGLPAAGWVEKLYVVGDKLMADFADIPAKIYELIEKKAYRKVSVEMFWNAKVNQKLYKRFIGAIALLGANAPGVENLNDILSLYTKCEGELKIYEGIEFIGNSTITPFKGDRTMEKTEREIKLELDLESQKKEFAAAQLKLKETEDAAAATAKEVAELKEFKAQAEKDKMDLALKAEKAEQEKFIGELVNDKLCSPAMKPFIAELLGQEKKEYTLKIQDQETKMTKAELLKETLKLFKAAADVNFEESSQFSKEQVDKEKMMDEKAKKYAAEKNCSYGQALKEVMKEEKQKS